MREIIFVAGMHRSGTSAMARLLALCGAGLPTDLVPAAVDNPAGFWEPMESVRLNDRLLHSKGSSLYDPFLLHLDPADKIFFINEAIKLLKVGFSKESTIVFKDPRVCVLFPLWLEAAERVELKSKVIHIFRNPDEVVSSLKAREGLIADHSQALWLKYNLEAERYTRRLPRTFVAYDEVMADPERVLRRCTDDLGLSLLISEDARAEIHAFVAPELRHYHASGNEAPSDPTSDGLLRRTYMALNAAARDQVVDTIAFDGLYGALEQLQDVSKAAVHSLSPPWQSVETTEAYMREFVGARQESRIALVPTSDTTPTPDEPFAGAAPASEGILQPGLAGREREGLDIRSFEGATSPSGGDRDGPTQAMSGADTMSASSDTAAVQLPRGDYISPGFRLFQPDHAFPHIRVGNKYHAVSKYTRRSIDHNWYVDDRQPTVGLLNRDESSILYNSARLFAGRRCLEISCGRGWSSAHIVAGAGHLEIVDPVLADPDWRADVEQSLIRVGHLDRTILVGEPSQSAIEMLAANDYRPWSFVFINGNHDGDELVRDACTVIKHSAQDALILLHGLLAPSVARALTFLREQGWHTMVYQTAQTMGAAWRGGVTPLAHKPDPSQVWDLPEHLWSFPVSGEDSAERAKRFGMVIEDVARSRETSAASTMLAPGAVSDLRRERDEAREVLAEVRADAERRIQAVVTATEQANGAHMTERWRLHRMALTLQGALTEREAEVETLLEQSKAVKTRADELSSRWADAVHRWKSTESEVEITRHEAGALRERLLAAELRRNRLFRDLHRTREERDRLAECLEQIQAKSASEEVSDEVMKPGPQGTESQRATVRETLARVSNGDFVRRGRRLVAAAFRHAPK